MLRCLYFSLAFLSPVRHAICRQPSTPAWGTFSSWTALSTILKCCGCCCCCQQGTVLLVTFKTHIWGRSICILMWRILVDLSIYGSLVLGSVWIKERDCMHILNGLFSIGNHIYLPIYIFYTLSLYLYFWHLVPHSPLGDDHGRKVLFSLFQHSFHTFSPLPANFSSNTLPP